MINSWHMPLYEYACDACEHRFEELRRVSEQTLPACPRCGQETRRVITAPALSFKGEGFYATDYRNLISESKGSGSK